MIEFEEEEEAAAGAPAWMATFADLMSLLMCFFVLLLSFSEMDVEKYKQVAGSMRDAFGVQNKIEISDIPKGTSVIAQEFSPGTPTTTPIDTINQVTTDITKQNLEVGSPDASDYENMSKEQVEEALEQKLAELLEQTKSDADKIKRIVKDEIATGKVDIETNGRSIIVRIRENGSFPSGSATLNQQFMPVMSKLRAALAEVPGNIAVEGHTDNVPIGGGSFESNWDLSASRALSVAHGLMRSGIIPEDRFLVVGHGETKPFTANDTAEGRAMNRRVELVIKQGLGDTEESGLGELLEGQADALQALGVEI